MKLVADLHIHSHFSRATSGNLTFEHLTRWAQLKGIHVVGTGDITHPGWLREMREKLIPAEDGLYRLKDELESAVQTQVPPACRATVRFILSGEISNIYKRGERTRKVHNVVFAPSFEAVERLQARLERIGNIRADGRPILGLDSRDLLEIVLDTDPACHLIPAHIWTPWFSLLGSKSGFDSVEECFGDLTPHIFALETGLSSDPPMNWRVSALDRYALVSNSDAHSPEKLGREANVFDCELAYGALFDALRNRRGAAGPDSLLPNFVGTIEFFPEEGKYHFDGHRACNVVWDPATTLARNGLCPICGKEVTVGVMHRVAALADRPEGSRPAQGRPFDSLVPLPEVLGEVYRVGDSSKQVQAEYAKLLARLGPDLMILRDAPLADIAKAGGERLAEGIGRMRRGEVIAQPGYDGEYGVIRVFGGAAARAPETQMGLFGEAGEGRETEDEERGLKVREQGIGRRHRIAETPMIAEAPIEHLPGAVTPIPRAAVYETVAPPHAARDPRRAAQLLAALNPEQRAAVLCTEAPLIIVAGPGTGKTHTLTVRIAYLVLEKNVAPENLLAITFTNKAAAEMRDRLDNLLGPEAAGRVTIKTFHAFGALLLREHAGLLGLSPDFAILTEEERATLLRLACPELKQAEISMHLAEISAAKCGGEAVQEDISAERTFQHYQAALRNSNSVDFDDLILLPIRLLEEHPEVLAAVQANYRWISVDEYQDVNAAQYRFLRLLTSGANLCVIGDPDQAIYGFRGSDRRYFLQFEQDYPGAMSLNLSRNYRSTQLILDAAMQVIAHRGEAPSSANGATAGGALPLQAVQVLAQFADRVKLDVHRAPTDKAEAEYVVHQIEGMVGGTSYFSRDSGRTDGVTPTAARSFADFAVLYRLSAQSRLLIEAFDRSGIPYQAVGQKSLYEHRAVRDVLAYLWLLQNPCSLAHLETLLAAGKPALNTRHLGELLHTRLSDAFEAAARARGLNARQQQRAALLAGAWRNLVQAQQAGAPVARLLEQAIATSAQQQGEAPGEADVERLHQLTLRAVPFENRLADFLESTALQSETDAYDPRADRVTLMSLHASKGLEFPTVFIVGCEEGLLPYERKGEPVDVEEERRLFYVGLTRAQHKLVLTRAAKRVLFGQFMENRESRFVGDIEAALKELQEMQYRRPEKKPDDEQLSLF